MEEKKIEVPVWEIDGKKYIHINEFDKLINNNGSKSSGNVINFPGEYHEDSQELEEYDDLLDEPTIKDEFKYLLSRLKRIIPDGMMIKAKRKGENKNNEIRKK